MTNNHESDVFRLWKSIAEQSIKDHGYFAVALSGGKTPIRFFKELTSHRDDLPWDQTYLFITDERFVPLDHPDSNYRSIHHHLWQPLALKSEQLFYIDTTSNDLELAAKTYEQEIKRFFKSHNLDFPVFDLIVLGIGLDGHTASLFPNHPVLHEKDHWVSSVIYEGVNHKRVTMTFPLINHAKNIIFLTNNMDKKEIVKRVQVERTPLLPASFVHPAEGNLYFIGEDDETY